MVNYDELAGKIIDYEIPTRTGMRKARAMVAAIDPAIGITLVNADDHEV